MTEQDKEQLNIEISHIFESGANHLRIFEMVENFIDKRYKAINYTHCCTELNHDFSIGDDAWLVEKKIVEINDFCASPNRMEIIDDGKYRLVDIDQLNKVV